MRDYCDYYYFVNCKQAVPDQTRPHNTRRTGRGRERHPRQHTFTECFTATILLYSIAHTTSPELLHLLSIYLLRLQQQPQFHHHRWRRRLASNWLWWCLYNDGQEDGTEPLPVPQRHNWPEWGWWHMPVEEYEGEINGKEDGQVLSRLKKIDQLRGFYWHTSIVIPALIPRLPHLKRTPLSVYRITIIYLGRGRQL